jgi:hypothetical protein
MATGCGQEGRGFIPSSGKIFLSCTGSGPVLGSNQPPIQLVPGALSPQLKQQGHNADHAPLSSAEVKKGGAIYLLPYKYLCLLQDVIKSALDCFQKWEIRFVAQCAVDGNLYKIVSVILLLLFVLFLD